MDEKLLFFKCKGCNGTIMAMDALMCKAPTPDALSVSCAGTEMDLLEEQKADPATQKHVPIVEKAEGGIKVKVGSTAHPMEEAHYIMWIAVQKGRNVMIHYLKPGEAPEAFFPGVDTDVKAFECCNNHNLWVNK